MRILYLHQHFKSPDMNGSTRSYEMAKRWASAGHDIHVICAGPLENNQDSRWSEQSLAGFTVHKMGLDYTNTMSYAERIRVFFRFAYHSAKRATSLGGDVVFASSTPLTIALPGVRAAKALGIPMVFEVRDLWPEMPIAIGALKNPLMIFAAKQLEKYAYRNSSHVIALSPGMAEGVIRTGYPAERITVIPNSCDFELFNDQASAGEKFLARHPGLCGKKIVAYTGTLGKINGVGYLADIARETKKLDDSIVFVIAGEGAEFALVRDKAAQYGILDDNFFMIGSVRKTEIPQILGAASIATSVVIDLVENWNNSANKFFDAMAAAKPIMINHLGWQADLLNENNAGIVVPPDDPATAAAQLNELLNDDQKLAESGRASYELGKQNFDRDTLSSRALEVLTRAAAAV